MELAGGCCSKADGGEMKQEWDGMDRQWVILHLELCLGSVWELEHPRGVCSCWWGAQGGL